MRSFFGAATFVTLVALSAPASAQFGGGGGGGLDNGTGDATARNLPSTVGIGRQTGNNYYSGVGGGEQPYFGGRSAYRRGRPPVYYGDGDAYSNATPYGYPRAQGYGYGFGRYPY